MSVRLRSMANSVYKLRGSTSKISFGEISRQSDQFRPQFPTTKNRVQHLVNVNAASEEEIEKFANDTRVLLHAETFEFARRFLYHKIKHGSQVEKAYYKTLCSDFESNGQLPSDGCVYTFISSLLRKRAVFFLNPWDTSMLRNGERPDSGDWDRVGTDNEGQIHLSEYMSYDEIAISALVNASSPAVFISNGSRTNGGEEGVPGTFLSRGIYTGIIGARFERMDKMESLHLLLQADKQKRSAPDPTLQKLWAKLYRQQYHSKPHIPLHFSGSKSKESGKYKPVNGGFLLDTHAYKRRIRLTLDPVFLDANVRAIERDSVAYVRIVGAGLGVWMISDCQKELFFEAACSSLQDLHLPAVARVEFQWVVSRESPSVIEHDDGSKTIITTSKGDPADLLPEEYSSALLYSTYAWDGNALPGNEYWCGSLSASGDPAAACCSTIPELQNSCINTSFPDNIVVCGHTNGSFK